MTVRRILTGGIMQESHSFNPILATRADFAITSGDEAVSGARGTNSILGGIVDSAEREGFEVVVPVMYQAQSGGPVEQAVFDEVRDAFVAEARRGNYDAIVLALHGGMLTTEMEDPEGALFASLREVIGNGVPITAAFDLHAHVTPDTLTCCDFLTAYRTNPHSDQAESGERACMAAIGMVRGAFDPVCASVHVPMLTLGADRTDRPGPLQDIHSYAEDLRTGRDAYDVSIFNAQQFLDVAGLGQTILVYTNGRPDEARALADDVARRHWDNREGLIGEYPDLEEQLDRADSGKGPLILGDQGDRVAAGGPGDSTFILHALVDRHPDLKAIVPIADAEATEACFAAGEGAEVTMQAGGRVSTVAPPVELTGKVITLGDRRPLTVNGPHEAGRRMHTPRFAVVRSRNCSVVLTTTPNAFIDPAIYEAMDLKPAAMDIVITRSGYHFSLNYAPVGECITVDTPGMTSYRVHELPWTVARPFYPVDQIDYRPVNHLRRRTT